LVQVKIMLAFCVILLICISQVLIVAILIVKINGHCISISGWEHASIFKHALLSQLIQILYYHSLLRWMIIVEIVFFILHIFFFF